MTDYSKLHFLENSITLSSAGTSDYIDFYFDDEYIREESWLDADFVCSGPEWMAISVDYDNSQIEYDLDENSGTTSRQGKLYIRGKVLYEGDSYYTWIDDSMTIIQEGSVAGTGSISADTGTTVIKAEGEQSSFEYTITNCDLSTLTITPDGNWSGEFIIVSYDENSCIYTVTENSGTNARTISVQISAKMSDADEYAYAYVKLLQPSTNDVGYFLFPDGDTVVYDYSAQTDSAYFEATHISAITRTYSSEYYWLSSGWTIWNELQYDEQEDKLYGDLHFWVSGNPYNFPRTGYLTIEGISTVDGSTVKGRLYIEQEANTTGVTQTAFLTCEEPYKALTSPDAQCNYFYFGRTNVNKNSVQIDSRNTVGNFETGYPTLNRDTGVVNFCLKAATSTTEWTYSQIAVIGYSNDGHGNPANTLILTIAQPPYIERLIFPIWQDTDVEIENRGEYVDYIITTGSTTIYSGRAYTLGGKCTVRLNTILENYLKPQLNVTVNGMQNKGAYLDATLKVFNGTEYQDYKRIYTYYDWSYKPQYSYIISKPIFKELDRRQLLLCSFYDNDGEMLGVNMELSKGGTKQFYGYDFDNRIGTIVQDIYDTDSVLLIAGDRDEIEYKVKDTCKRYCLYYLNACGGWDSFLFENTSKETDNFTRSTYKKNINNQTHQFNKVEFKNTIVKSWTLKTCYLNDAQSLNLAENMIGSTCCYLHDFEANKIYPVLLTNKKTDYLTFNKNGRKMCRYDITAELAQDRKRT